MVVFFVFTSIIIVSVLTGVFATHFDEFYNKMTDEVLEVDPGYKKLILHCMEAPILKPDDVKKSFAIYHKDGVDALHTDMYEVLENEADTGVRERAVEHHDRLDPRDVQGQNNFKKLYQSVPYNVVLGMVDMVIVFLPIYKLDTFDNTLPSKNCYLYSEVFSMVSLAEFMIVTRNYPDAIKNKLFRLKFVSSLVIFVTANYLQYSNYDLDGVEIYQHPIMFKLWALASLCKILGIHNLLKYSSRWVSIIRGIRQVVPMLQDLILMYIVILLVFGVVGNYMFGGMINSVSKVEYKKMTGNDLSDNWEHLNFNDT